MNDPRLTFDAESHTYRWCGALVPNVTRIIAPLTDYSRIPPDVLERARRQGTEIHKMVELSCKGTLDVDDIMTREALAWLRPYLQAWRKFVLETGFELWESEQKVFHGGFHYAGTLDLVGLMKKTKLRDPALLDVKRSFYAGRAIGVQTAGYEEARNREVDKVLRTRHRYGLQLRHDGNYRLQPFEDRGDASVFLACLTLHRWNAKEIPQ